MRTFSRCDLRLQLLGDWLLTAADDRVGAVAQIELPAGPQHLVALLALNSRCARTHAAAMLWPDCTDEVAAARLRAILWRLRHRHVGVPPLLDHRRRVARSG